MTAAGPCDGCRNVVAFVQPVEACGTLPIVLAAAHKVRLIALTEPWCTTQLVKDLLGLDLDTDQRLASAFRDWTERFRNGAALKHPGSSTEVHRHHLEMYLLQNGLVTMKWAAASLGMKPNTLTVVLDKLESRGRALEVRAKQSDQLVRQREVSRLVEEFRHLRYQVFGDHNDLCRALHHEIQDDLDIQVDMLFCVTSQIIDRDAPDYAIAFDAITDEPVGVRHQVWLDTGKPMMLSPDVCSLKLYAQYRDELQRYVMKGSEPIHIPAVLYAA